MHLATGAVVNAVWDLLAKDAGKPVWQLVGEMTPEQLVAIIDFRYLTDAITPDEALAIFRKAEPGKAERIADAQGRGLSLLHDLGRLARLFQREADAACHRGGRRRASPTSR